MKEQDLSNQLESVLRDFLNCHYNDFGVKAQWLFQYDWKSPINFVLGYKYAVDERQEVKEDISYFLGNTFIGENINDLIANFEKYDFNSKNEVIEYIEKQIILELNRILDM